MGFGYWQGRSVSEVCGYSVGKLKPALMVVFTAKEGVTHLADRSAVWN